MPEKLFQNENCPRHEMWPRCQVDIYLEVTWTSLLHLFTKTSLMLRNDLYYLYINHYNMKYKIFNWTNTKKKSQNQNLLWIPLFILPTTHPSLCLTVLVMLCSVTRLPYLRNVHRDNMIIVHPENLALILGQLYCVFSSGRRLLVLIKILTEEDRKS